MQSENKKTKKLALLLFGISYGEYRHFWGRNMKIDYKISVENYKTFIFEYFENLGYEIDVFFATNKMDDDEKEKLLEIYKPVDYVFMGHNNDKRVGRNDKFRSVMDLCLKHKDNNYDHVLMTRFDLLFKKKFQESHIEFDKINLVSILEEDHYVCDNFYFFPIRILERFKQLCDLWKWRRFHDLKHKLEEIWGIDSIHYILNEHVWIGGLSFYEIVRTRV